MAVSPPSASSPASTLASTLASAAAAASVSLTSRAQPARRQELAYELQMRARVRLRTTACTASTACTAAAGAAGAAGAGAAGAGAAGAAGAGGSADAGEWSTIYMGSTCGHEETGLTPGEPH